MITFSRGKQIGLVHQSEHAQLSRNISKASPHSTSESLEIAIRHHDDGWTEYDEVPKLRENTILDYRSTSLDDHLQILTRSVQRTLKRDQYAGWLVSRHGCSFHEEKTGERVEQFLEKQQTLRNQIKQEENLPEDRNSNFNWLQFVDALSLYVVDPWSEELSWDRKPPGEGIVVPVDTNRYRYEGAGFDPGPRTFTVECKYVPADARSSSERLRNTYRSAATQSRTITIEFGNSTIN